MTLKKVDLHIFLTTYFKKRLQINFSRHSIENNYFNYIQEIMEAFQAFDRDGNGMISCAGNFSHLLKNYKNHIFFRENKIITNYFFRQN